MDLLLSGPSVLCLCNTHVDMRVMEDFTFAILDGLCLLQGSLRHSTPARIWSGTGWLTLRHLRRLSTFAGRWSLSLTRKRKRSSADGTATPPCRGPIVPAVNGVKELMPLQHMRDRQFHSGVGDWAITLMDRITRGVAFVADGESAAGAPDRTTNGQEPLCPILNRPGCGKSVGTNGGGPAKRSR